MSLKPYITALAAFTLFLLALGVAASMATVSYQDNARDHTVTNESLTVDYTTASEVAPDGTPFHYQANETVWNASGGRLEESVDYTWNTSSGAVTWLNTSATTGGAAATITYTWHGQTETAGSMHTIQTELFGLLPWLGFVLAAFGVLGLFAGFAYVYTTNTPGVTR